MTLRHTLTVVLELLGLVAVATVFARIPILAHLPLVALVAFLLCVRRAPPLRLACSIVATALILDLALAHPIGVRALLLLAALLLGTKFRVALRSRYHLGIALLLAVLLALAEYCAIALPTLTVVSGGWVTIIQGAALTVGTMVACTLLMHPRISTMRL